MMRQVARALLEHQPDMAVVVESLGPLKILLSASETTPDVVVIVLHDAEEPGLISHLSTTYPKVTILLSLVR